MNRSVSISRRTCERTTAFVVRVSMFTRARTRGDRDQERTLFRTMPSSLCTASVSELSDCISRTVSTSTSLLLELLLLLFTVDLIGPVAAFSTSICFRCGWHILIIARLAGFICEDKTRDPECSATDIIDRERTDSILL